MSRNKSWGSTVSPNPSLSTVFKISGLLGAQITKLFYMLTCFQSSACSAQGFTTWLLKPGTFSHPYSWYWSWTQYPKGYWYIGAPYGYLWYGLNATAIFGFLAWMFSLLFADTIVSYTIIRRESWPFIILWMVSSQFFLNWDPVDYHVFMFSVLGVYNPIFSILALLVKLPVGAPGYVWSFVFDSPVSAGWSGNWPRYAWFGSWWLYGVYRSRRLSLRLLRQTRSRLDHSISSLLKHMAW